MTTVIGVVDALAGDAHSNYRHALATGDALLAKHGVVTPLRVAHFLAQVMHETGGLKVLEENMSYRADRIMVIFGVGKHSAAVTSIEAQRLAGNPRDLAERVYGIGNPRKSRELGNTSPGDGYRYRGRGIMQTTGRTNYSRLGKRAGVDFEQSPELVVSPNFALIPALLEWTEGNLNVAADRNDIDYITRRINGGYNGLADRQRWFNAIWQLVQQGITVDGAPVAAKAEVAWKAAQPNPVIKLLQGHLRELGIAPTLVVDGLFGPKTKQALIDFQTLANLPADGVYGPVTAAAIDMRLASLR